MKKNDSRKTLQNALPLFCLGTILSFTANFLIILSCSYFLKNLGIQYLPLFYIVTNLLSIVLGSYIVIRNISNFRGLIVLSIVMTIAFYFIFCLFETPFKGIFFITYVFATFFLIYSMIYFWNFINVIFSMAEMKAYIGTITTGIFLGGVSSGLLIKTILNFISPKTCYLCASCIIGIVVLILLNYRRHFECWEERNRSKSVKFLPGELFEIETVRLLLFFTLTFVFIRYLVDFQFSKYLTLNFADPRSLSSFLGFFNAGVYILIFCWQVFMFQRTLRAYPIASFFAFIAFCFLILSIVCFIHPHLITLALFQASVLFLIKTFKQPAQNIIIRAVIPEMRSRANFLLCGIAESVSIMVSGLVIALLNVFRVPSGSFFIIILIGASLSFLLTFRLKRAYIDLLLMNLRSRAPEIITPHVQGDEYNPAIIFEAGSRESEGQILHLLKSEKESYVLATLINSLSSLQKNSLYCEEILRIMKRNGDFRLVTQCIDTLAIWNAAEYTGTVSEQLSSENPWIKSSALMFIIRLSADEAHTAKAVMELLNMIHSSDPLMRGLAVSIQGDLGLECFASCIGRLLSDEDIKVRKRAIVAAQKLQSPSLLPILHRMACRKENENLRYLLTKVIKSMNDTLYEEILFMTRSLSLPDRQKVTECIRSLENQNSLEIILRGLKVLGTPLSLAVVEYVSSAEVEEEALETLTRCFREKDFSFVPLIQYAAAGSLSPGLDNIIYSIGMSTEIDLFAMEFSQVAGSISPGEMDRDKAQELLYLGIKAVMGREQSRVVIEHIFSSEKKEDLSSEVIESSIRNRNIKESLLHLLNLVSS